uniref:EF-hand domain-containing protein n=3 Tax=Auxenochlorella protothecoides TaxID=3075 RepID=A0A1D2ACS5_AUXPR
MGSSPPHSRPPSAADSVGDERASLIPRRHLMSYVSEPPSSLFAMAKLAEEEKALEQEALLKAMHVPEGPLPHLGPRATSLHPGGEAPVPPGPHLRSNLVWFQAREASHFQERVLEHPVAGDLAVAEAAETAALRGVPRPGSRSPGAPQHKPPPKLPAMMPENGAPGHAAGRSAGGVKADPGPLSPRGRGEKSGGPNGAGDDEEVDPLENDLDWTTGKRPAQKFYKRRWFWLYVIPLSISASLVILGACYVHFASSTLLGDVQLWRLLFFLAGLPIIWYFGDFVTWAAVWGVEKSLFTWKNALYFAYAVRRPLSNVLRAALGLAWWAGMMTIGAGAQPSNLNTAYTIILRVWACITLMMTANLLKTLIAKLLSSKFVRESHLAKMQQSIKKEHLLHLLLQPRQSYIDAAKEYEVEGPDTWDGEAEADKARDPGGRRTQSAFSLSPGAWSGKKGGLARRVTKLFARKDKPAPGPGDDAQPPRDLENPPPPRPAPRAQAKTESPGAEAAWGKGGTPDSTPRASPSQTASQASQPSTPRLGGAQPARARPGDAATSGAPAAPRGCQLGTEPTLRVRLGPGPQALRRQSSRSQHSAGAGTPQKGRRPPPGGAGGARPSPVKSAHGGARGGVAAPVTRASQLLDEEDGDGAATPHRLSRRSAQRTSTAQARAAVTSAQDVKPKNVAGSSTSGVRPQQAMRLARMEKYIRRNALQVTFRDELNQAERREVVNSDQEAKKLAFYLFWNVKADYGRSHIVDADLAAFVPARDVRLAAELLDADGDGVITSQDVCAAILQVFRERQNLAASLTDTKSVVGKLETMVGVVLHIVMAFLYLVIFRVDVMNFYLTFSSMILAFSFIFNQSLRMIYENAVFLFVIHPYDIGDTLLLDKQACRVDAINLTYTTMTDPSNAQLWYPNEKLRAAPFINLSASGNRCETLAVAVDVDTPLGVAEDLRAAAAAVTRLQPKEVDGEPGVALAASPDPLKYVLEVSWTLSHNGVDAARGARLRNAVHAALFARLAELGVRSSAPPPRAPGNDAYGALRAAPVHEAAPAPSREATQAGAAQARAQAGLAAAVQAAEAQQRRGSPGGALERPV